MTSRTTPSWIEVRPPRSTQEDFLRVLRAFAYERSDRPESVMCRCYSANMISFSYRARYLHSTDGRRDDITQTAKGAVAVKSYTVVPAARAGVRLQESKPSA